jgi:mannobiose 2-epimerase
MNLHLLDLLIIGAYVSATIAIGFWISKRDDRHGGYREAFSRDWGLLTKRHLLDMENGEWHRRVARDGALRPGHEKVGPWKCPYHTARACLEVMERSPRIARVARAS